MAALAVASGVGDQGLGAVRPASAHAALAQTGASSHGGFGVSWGYAIEEVSKDHRPSLGTPTVDGRSKASLALGAEVPGLGFLGSPLKAGGRPRSETRDRVKIELGAGS